MRKNYYVILGIQSDASPNEVKAAFRRRAMELHPDRSGLECGPFLELQEAYGVLSDVERRRRYDTERGSVATRRHPWGPASEPLRERRTQAEPFRPAEPVPDLGGPSLESFGRHVPSFDELFERLWSNFDSFDRPKAEHLESLTVEIVITSSEARRGGSVRLGVPARATCPSCGGIGAVGSFACWRCDGQGSLTGEYPVEVRYPPGLRDGHAVRLPLRRFGIENFYLTVLFRVSGGGQGNSA
jgi:DnaJ-class molecular chaperone